MQLISQGRKKINQREKLLLNKTYKILFQNIQISFFYSRGDETLAQVAQKGDGGHIPGDIH